jgi:hypothetical protein
MNNVQHNICAVNQPLLGRPSENRYPSKLLNLNFMNHFLKIYLLNKECLGKAASAAGGAEREKSDQNSYSVCVELSFCFKSYISIEQRLRGPHRWSGHGSEQDSYPYCL